MSVMWRVAVPWIESDEDSGDKAIPNGIEGLGDMVLSVCVLNEPFGMRYTRTRTQKTSVVVAIGL